MLYKRCTKCGAIRDLSLFHRRKDGMYGRSSICKACVQNAIRSERRTKHGKIRSIYNCQKSSSKSRNHPAPDYSLKELSEWAAAQKLFHDLFYNWLKSGYDKLKAPSIDRIEISKPYTLDNLRIVTWEENKRNGELDIKNGKVPSRTKSVIGINIETGERRKYFSINEAVRNTGASRSNIIACCKKRETTSPSGKKYYKKTAGGYKWEYV